MTNETTFKVNDYVIDIKYGKGQIIGLKPESSNHYCLIALFSKKNNRANYTKTGVRQGHSKPSLVLDTDKT